MSSAGALTNNHQLRPIEEQMNTGYAAVFTSSSMYMQSTPHTKYLIN